MVAARSRLFEFRRLLPIIEATGFEFLPRIPQSEDCLKLNVFATLDKIENVSRRRVI